MASEGPRSGGTFANDNSFGSVAWSTPENAASSNDLFADLNIFGGQTTQYLKVTNFGFSIPSGATIDGIVVSIERYASPNGTTRDSRVRLVKGGTVQATDKASGSAWPNGSGASATANYGGAADLWSGTWTDSDINSSGFGVVLAATNIAAKDPESVAVDHITITVHYTEGGGGSGAEVLTRAHQSSGGTLTLNGGFQ